MLGEIFAFISFMIFFGLAFWFLYEVIKLEKKRAAERKAKEDMFIETLVSIDYRLASISNNFSSVAFEVFRISDTLEELLDFDDLT